MKIVNQFLKVRKGRTVALQSRYLLPTQFKNFFKNYQKKNNELTSFVMQEETTGDNKLLKLKQDVQTNNPHLFVPYLEKAQTYQKI